MSLLRKPVKSAFQLRNSLKVPLTHQAHRDCNARLLRVLRLIGALARTGGGPDGLAQGLQAILFQTLSQASNDRFDHTWSFINEAGVKL